MMRHSDETLGIGAALVTAVFTIGAVAGCSSSDGGTARAEGVNGDVRVTTRFVPHEPFTGLMGALHETGQALYDLGLPEEVSAVKLDGHNAFIFPQASTLSFTFGALLT